MRAKAVSECGRLQCGSRRYKRTSRCMDAAARVSKTPPTRARLSRMYTLSCKSGSAKKSMASTSMGSRVGTQTLRWHVTSSTARARWSEQRSMREKKWKKVREIHTVSRYHRRCQHERKRFYEPSCCGTALFHHCTRRAGVFTRSVGDASQRHAPMPTNATFVVALCLKKGQA